MIEIFLHLTKETNIQILSKTILVNFLQKKRRFLSKALKRHDAITA